MAIMVSLSLVDSVVYPSVDRYVIESLEIFTKPLRCKTATLALALWPEQIL